MFRELIRKNKKLSMEECIHVLKTEKRGVLSVKGDNDYPYGMPMNHWYNEDDGKIYFHCGKIGHRLKEIVDELNKIIDITTKLSYKFIQDDEYIKAEIEKHAHRTLLLVLTPEHICGKLVEES